MAYIGIDTSCYTTSVAAVDETGILCDLRIPLRVKRGERGLRQSEAVFQHIKNIDRLFPELTRVLGDAKIQAVAVSCVPRNEEGSYMPVFLTGKMAANAVASALNVPCYHVSHQQGHIRAALYGNEGIAKRFIALHMSGGTSEAIIVDEQLQTELIGGSSDLHAGQLVDRIGVALGCTFPCGKYLEALAHGCNGEFPIVPASVKGVSMSFSGAEDRLKHEINCGSSHEAIAYAVYDLLARSLSKFIRNAREISGNNTVLLAGGVSSSLLLRKLLIKRLDKKQEASDIYFARSELSSDNAVGVSMLAADMYKKSMSV